MQEWISFAVEPWNRLKTRTLDKSSKEKEDRMCKIAIRNAGMKQDDVAGVLNVSQSVVSRPLKENREREWQYYKKETVYIDSWVQGIITDALWYVVHYLTTT